MTQQLSKRTSAEAKNQIRALNLALVQSIFPFGLIFLTALWVLFTVPQRYRAEVALRSRAFLTSGLVTDKRVTTSCSSTGSFSTTCTTNCNTQVEFRTPERETLRFWDSCYRSAGKGRTVPVLYDPKQIFQPRINRGDSPESLAISQLIWSLLFGIGSFCVLLAGSAPAASPTNKIK
jgi:hypothetical protein